MKKNFLYCNFTTFYVDSIRESQQNIKRAMGLRVMYCNLKRPIKATQILSSPNGDLWRPQKLVRHAHVVVFTLSTMKERSISHQEKNVQHCLYHGLFRYVLISDKLRVKSTTWHDSYFRVWMDKNTFLLGQWSTMDQIQAVISDFQLRQFRFECEKERQRRRRRQQYERSDGLSNRT